MLRLRPFRSAYFLATLVVGLPALAGPLLDAQCETPEEAVGRLAAQVEAIVAPSPSPIAKKAPLPTPTPTALSRRGYITPAEMRTLDSRKLGELIVRRLFNECESVRSDTKDPEGGVFKESQIVMLVPSKVLESVIKNGFKNQHVTRTTNGCNCTQMRRGAESNMTMLELPYNAAGLDLLPKYSLFNIKRDDFGSYNIPSSYGDMAFVFKEDVKKRTTWTTLDSLLDSSTSYFSGSEYSHTMPPRTFGAVKKASDRLRCRSSWGSSYCEAQIWGELDITDVDYILLEDGASVPPVLVELGIPVKRFARTTNPKQAAMIVEGSPVPEVTPKPGIDRKPASISREELEKLVATSSGPLRNIYQIKLLPMLSEQELLERIKVTPVTGTDKGFSYSSHVEAVDVLLAELAIRPKTPSVIKALESTLDAAGTDFGKAQALLGLSELPKDKLKPHLLKAMKSAGALTRRMAAAIALDFPDDMELRDLFKEMMTKDYDVSNREYLKRLSQPTLCLPGPKP